MSNSMPPRTTANLALAANLPRIAVAGFIAGPFHGVMFIPSEARQASRAVPACVPPFTSGKTQHKWIAKAAAALVAMASTVPAVGSAQPLRTDQRGSGADLQRADAGLRIVLGPDLSAKQAYIQSVQPDGTVTLRWSQTGKLQRLPPGQVLAVLLPLSAPVAAQREPASSLPVAGAEQLTSGLLALTDGQVFPGSVLPQATATEEVRWLSRQLGEVLVPLKIVREITLSPEVVASSRQPGRNSAVSNATSLPSENRQPLDPKAGQQADDQVFMINGDVATGFVASIGQNITVESGQAATEIPIERVNRVRLANPSVPSSGGRLWLVNGTVVAVSSLALQPLPIDAQGASSSSQPPLAEPTYNPGSVRGVFTTPLLDRPAEVVLSDLAAFVFNTTKLVPLASLSFVSGASSAPVDGAARRWVPAPVVADARVAPLGAADILLPGPMAVTWQLPANAARFAASIQLPQESIVWGDCEVIGELVTPQGSVRSLWQHRLNSANPEIDINILIVARQPGDLLRIQVREGERGPIFDRVLLRRALFVAEVEQ